MRDGEEVKRDGAGALTHRRIRVWASFPLFSSSTAPFLSPPSLGNASLKNESVYQSAFSVISPPEALGVIRVATVFPPFRLFLKP